MRCGGWLGWGQGCVQAALECLAPRLQLSLELDILKLRLEQPPTDILHLHAHATPSRVNNGTQLANG